MMSAEIEDPAVPQPVSACPLCMCEERQALAEAVKDFEYGAPGEYTWLKCSRCQLVGIAPIPGPEILEQAYPSDYHAYVPAQSKLTRKLQSLSRQRTARAHASLAPTAGSILDIGCSTGLLLSAIGDLGRYQLFGVEYDRVAAASARARGIQVWEGDFADADIPPNSMDLVIAQHVLEHVLDPIETLRKIMTILKPGGRLAGELPNLDSWDARLFGRYWGGGHAPRHIFHFTPETLTRALHQCGFGETRIEPSLHTGHWALSIQNYLRRHKRTLQGLHSGRAWYYAPLLLATVPVNLLQMKNVKTGVMRFETVREA